jgi:Tol biopolymer transport system component
MRDRKKLAGPFLAIALLVVAAPACGGEAVQAPPATIPEATSISEPATPILSTSVSEGEAVQMPPTSIPEATSTSEPATSVLSTSVGGGMHIAFVSDRDGNQEIYVMSADGSEQTNLTNHEADDNWPTMSPDGDQIAFISNRDDPNRATCALDLSCDSDIYILRTDGSGLSRLTDTPGQEMYPAWSPDGSKIAFMREFDILVMNVDGSNQTNLTSDSTGNLYPAWMPDGSRIVFLSLRDGGFQFYEVNVDGSDIRMLDSGLPPSELSPGSFGIYFFEDGEIWIGGGGSLESIQDSGSALGEFPTWSPDGTRVAFHSSRDGDMEIYVMNADRSSVTQLTSNEARDMFPAWSPDGTQIAFHSDRDGNMEIYLVNADGSDPRNLTRNPAGDRAPVWHP